MDFVTHRLRPLWDAEAEDRAQLRARRGVRPFSIFLRFFSHELAQSIIDGVPRQSWHIRDASFLNPSLGRVYKMLAAKIWMYGRCTTARPTDGSGARPQQDGIAESSDYFKTKFSAQIEHGSKELKPDCEQYISKLLAHINISANHYRMLSDNFRSVVRSETCKLHCGR